MKTIEVPSKAQLNTESQAILEQIEKRMGRVPNLYATIGYSAQALKGLLDYEATLTKSSAFDAKEREAINLIVSQVNDCEYCLAAHTALAKMRGFSEEDTIAIRKAAYTGNDKLESVILLSRSIAVNKGKADAGLVERFFAAGYNEAALMQLIGLITARTFTNYVFAVSNIPVDFPAAAPLS